MEFQPPQLLFHDLTVKLPGVIKGKRFGTVKIYVLAVNGVRTYVKVTVK